MPIGKYRRSQKIKDNLSRIMKNNPRPRCKTCGSFLKKDGTCNHFHSENHRIYKGYCKNCGKYYEGRGKEYCSRKCVGQIYSPFKKGKLHFYFGKKSPSWKGGKFLTAKGYVMVHKPEHPYCNSMGYVQEHRLVMEKHLGRYLIKKEKVHHIDGNIVNNKIENLHLFKNESEHQKYHQKLRKIIRKLLEKN